MAVRLFAPAIECRRYAPMRGLALPLALFAQSVTGFSAEVTDRIEKILPAAAGHFFEEN